MNPSSNSGLSGAHDEQVGDAPAVQTDESFLASVASIWDADMGDLTTADAPLTDPLLDVNAAALTLPTPVSVCAFSSRPLT